MVPTRFLNLNNVSIGPFSGIYKSNGPTGWTPADITTLAWYDASDDSTIIESGGAVSQWDDKSGNSRHVSQATGANRPTWDLVDEITFDGINDYLSNTSPFMFGVGEIDIYIVATAPLSIAGGYFVAEGRSSQNFPVYGPALSRHDGTSSRMGAFQRTDGDVTTLDTKLLSPPSAFIGTRRQYLFRDTGTSAIGYLDGVEENTVAYTRSGGSTTLDRFAIGCLLRGSALGYINMNLNEIVITTNLSNDDRASMFEYFDNKWGL